MTYNDACAAAKARSFTYQCVSHVSARLMIAPDWLREHKSFPAQHVADPIGYIVDDFSDASTVRTYVNGEAT